ncbi:MAG: hypothetical protein JWR80_160 [Bradyrhizobium sp.]|nr:hypothetical protein [Bradyrhizobium sp.]
MGYAPEQVDRMNLWEFAACVDGFNRAQGHEEEAEPPSIDDHLKMVAAAKAMQAGR